MQLKAMLAVTIVATAGAAQAGGIGIRAGTTGLGADFGFDLAPTLGGRLGVSAMQVNTHTDTSEVRYDARAKVLTGALLLDWSPLGPFSLSGGFLNSDTKIDLTGESNAGGSFPA